MVYKAGVGIKPVPVTQLTREKLVEAFRELRSEQLVDAAQTMAATFAREDGAKEGEKQEARCCEFAAYIHHHLLRY